MFERRDGGAIPPEVGMFFTAELTCAADTLLCDPVHLCDEIVSFFAGLKLPFKYSELKQL
jgi:hypothetical protein